MSEYRFQRLGRFIPAVYAVHTPFDYLGNVEAVHGRPGQSRSFNLYRAYPANRRGVAAATPIGGRQEPTLYLSRREAADGILAYLREQGRFELERA